MKGCKSFFVLGLGALVCVLSNLSALASGTYSSIFSFCGTGYDSCTATGAVANGVVADGNGNLYGVETDTDGNGVVFELVKAQSGYNYQELYIFCSEPSCSDGAGPVGRLIIDANGNLYGATSSGGSSGYGTIYRLSEGQSGWSLTTLWNFCQNDSCKGGSIPNAGLTYSGASSGAAYDGKSSLFGTAESGGAYANGAVYELKTPAGTPSLKALYSFCPTSQCTTGVIPNQLIADSSGNLFGTTQAGGVSECQNGCGVVYELSIDETGGHTFSALYSFCLNQSQNCTDPISPNGSLVLDTAGNLYGTSGAGGNFGYGSLFKVVPNGTNSTIGNLYSFCVERGTCKNTGTIPQGLLFLSPTGQLYGTTVAGGQSAAGILFKLSGSAFTVLYNFCAQNNCTDGSVPSHGVTTDGAGNLLGTTMHGGDVGDGVVFEWSPS